LVSVIIPARNEQLSIARTVESVSLQQEVDEIIVVNDQSTDRTDEILAQLAQRIPKLRVLSTDELPARWVGKNYAASLGAAVASGDWLLFTDADTYHFQGSVERGLADAADHEALLVSYSPEQEIESFWEKALIPFVYCRLAERFAFARVNDPSQPDAAANGQFILILRDVYEAVGGHAAVGRQILEDVALARRVKQAGYGIYFAAPTGVVRTRMYRSFKAMWEGWTKNLYLLAGGSVKAVAAELVAASPWLELALLVALLALLRTGVPRSLLAVIAGALVGAIASRATAYASALYRNLYPVSYIQYCYLGSALYGAVLISSWWKSTRAGVVWKGRVYSPRIR
jgi:glycosyltransferase involved in cell wall biosynthesis